MKILFVIDSLGTGGAERSSAEVWYFLRAQGIDLSIVVLKHRKEGIEQEILREGFNVFFLSKKGVLAQALEISEYIKKLRPDLVHSTLFMSNLRVRLARLVTKFKHVESLISCTYDPIRLRDPRIRLSVLTYYKLLDKATYFLADHFLAITHTVKKHYEHFLKIPKDKISVIYRSRQPNKLLEERASLKRKLCAELAIPVDTLLVLHVARQEFAKGHLILLRALTLLSNTDLPPCAFVFVGREGETTPAIREYLSENKVPFKTFWLGHRYDIAEILAAGDLFVFPSVYEGLGGALIEAQAAGLPIICSDLPVLKEVVVEDENALMFQAGNDQQLANAIERLIRDRNKWEQMRAKGLENFRRKFLPKIISAHTIDFYHQMLGTKKVKI
jgi:glycosyltransferase involved in cell wall biosynthesis